MEKFFKRKTNVESSTSTSHKKSMKQSHIERDLLDLVADAGIRIRIMDYDSNIREQVHRG